MNSERHSRNPLEADLAVTIGPPQKRDSQYAALECIWSASHFAIF